MRLAETLRDFFTGGPVCAQQIAGEPASRAPQLAVAGMMALALAACGPLEKGPSTVHLRETVAGSTVAIALTDSALDRSCQFRLSVENRHLKGTVDCADSDSMPEAQRIAAEAGPALTRAVYRSGNKVEVDYTLPKGSRLHSLSTVYDIDASRVCSRMEMEVGTHTQGWWSTMKVGKSRIPVHHTRTVHDYETVESCRPLSSAPGPQRQELRHAAQLTENVKFKKRVAAALGDSGT